MDATPASFTGFTISPSTARATSTRPRSTLESVPRNSAMWEPLCASVTRRPTLALPRQGPGVLREDKALRVTRLAQLHARHEVIHRQSELGHAGSTQEDHAAVADEVSEDVPRHALH